MQTPDRSYRLVRYDNGIHVRSTEAKTRQFLRRAARNISAVSLVLATAALTAQAIETLRQLDAPITTTYYEQPKPVSPQQETIETPSGIALPAVTSPKARLEAWLEGFEGKAALLDCSNIKTPYHDTEIEGILLLTDPDQGNKSLLPVLDDTSVVNYRSGLNASSELSARYLLVTQAPGRETTYAVNPTSVNPATKTYQDNGLKLSVIERNIGTELISNMGRRGPIEKCAPKLLRTRMYDYR